MREFYLKLFDFIFSLSWYFISFFLVLYPLNFCKQKNKKFIFPIFEHYKYQYRGLQKSANYTCVSSNSVGQVSKSVYVYVVNRGTIELCTNESAFGVSWPASSPGSPILAECPKRYEGQSQRICEQRDFGKPTWHIPNFSNCLADSLVDVYNEVSLKPIYKKLFII